MNLPYRGTCDRQTCCEFPRTGRPPPSRGSLMLPAPALSPGTRPLMALLGPLVATDLVGPSPDHRKHWLLSGLALKLLEAQVSCPSAGPTTKPALSHTSSSLLRRWGAGPADTSEYLLITYTAPRPLSVLRFVSYDQQVSAQSQAQRVCGVGSGSEHGGPDSRAWGGNHSSLKSSNPTESPLALSLTHAH